MNPKKIKIRNNIYNTDSDNNTLLKILSNEFYYEKTPASNEFLIENKFFEKFINASE